MYAAVAPLTRATPLLFRWGIRELISSSLIGSHFLRGSRCPKLYLGSTGRTETWGRPANVLVHERHRSPNQSSVSFPPRGRRSGIAVVPPRGQPALSVLCNTGPQWIRPRYTPVPRPGHRATRHLGRIACQLPPRRGCPRGDSCYTDQAEYKLGRTKAAEQSSTSRAEVAAG